MPNKTLEARVTQHDKEIAAIRKLVLQGMKMLVRLETAQLTTEKKLQALIDALGGAGGGGNGKGRH